MTPLIGIVSIKDISSPCVERHYQLTNLLLYWKFLIMCPMIQSIEGCINPKMYFCFGTMQKQISNLTRIINQVVITLLILKAVLEVIGIKYT